MKRIPFTRSQCVSSTLKRYFSTPCKAYLEPTHATPSPTSVTTQDILNRGRQYLLPVYVRPEFVLSHGKGAWVWDIDGRKFLDFSAGIAVNALGHADEGVLKASP
jgi:acetylornithine aminotransferase